MQDPSSLKTTHLSRFFPSLSKISSTLSPLPPPFFALSTLRFPFCIGILKLVCIPSPCSRPNPPHHLHKFWKMRDLSCLPCPCTFHQCMHYLQACHPNNNDSRHILFAPSSPLLACPEQHCTEPKLRFCKQKPPNQTKEAAPLPCHPKVAAGYQLLNLLQMLTRFSLSKHVSTLPHPVYPCQNCPYKKMPKMLFFCALYWLLRCSTCD